MSLSAEWVKVASTSDLREGEGYDTGMEVAGTVVGLFLVDGKTYAVGECTHERGPVCQGQREGLVVMCPWHAAMFNIATGECQRGPVACRTDGTVDTSSEGDVARPEGLQRFEVKMEGDDVFVKPLPKSTHAPAETTGSRAQSIK